MDIISVVMLVLGAIGILFGFLYGKKRGLLKAIIRFVLVVAAAVGAFMLRESVTETILNTPMIEGETIVDALTKSLTEGENGQQMAGLANILVGVITMVLQIVLFILIFIAFRIETLIVFWIAAIIINAVKKGKLRRAVKEDVTSLEEKRKLSHKQQMLIASIKRDQEKLEADNTLSAKEVKRIEKRLAKNRKVLVKKTFKRDRKPWLGGLVGLAQGVVVVTCVLGPINGLISNGSSLVKAISEIELEGEKVIDEETNAMLEQIGVYAYPTSPVAKVYGTLGNELYKSISTVESADGTIKNFESQIQAIEGGAKMAGTVTKLTEINVEEGLTEDVKNELVTIFNELDQIKDSMSEESVKELDTLMKEVLTPMLGEAAEDLPIDLSTINFATVDFATEGEVISSFYDLYEKTESGEEVNDEELMETVVETLSESTLILPILSQIVEDLPEEEKPSLNEEEKQQMEEILNGLENQENVDEIKALFGLN